MSIKLRNGIWAAGIKRGLFVLRWRSRAEHFTAGGVVELRVQTRFPDRFQYANRSQPSDIAGVFRNIEAHANVTLRPEVVDFIRSHHPDNTVQGATVIQIPIQKKQTRVRFMRVLINMIDAAGI